MKKRVYRRLTGHDRREYVIREAEMSDAPLLVSHTRNILQEPQWSVTELDEFIPSADQEEQWISTFRHSPRSLLIVADFGTREAPEIGGMLNFNSQPRFRMRHRGRIGIGVQTPYRRIGVGEALMRTLLEWAEDQPDLERIELSVFAHNSRAISLYQKVGFVEEARLLRAYKLADGTYYDDVMMVKWIR